MPEMLPSWRQKQQINQQQYIIYKIVRDLFLRILQ